MSLSANSNELFMLRVCRWWFGDNGHDGKLTHWIYSPLDNRENKNSRNACLSQIRKNIFPRKFLLIQYCYKEIHYSTIPQLPNTTNCMSSMICVKKKDPHFGGWYVSITITLMPTAVQVHIHIVKHIHLMVGWMVGQQNKSISTHDGSYISSITFIIKWIHLMEGW